jgi:hypothetical protein
MLNPNEDAFMIEWLIPNQCWPALTPTNQKRVDELTEAMMNEGWGNHEALVGYHTYDGTQWKIQLLVGSHRWEAALRAKIRIPVVVVPETTIERAWGADLALWATILNMGKVHMRRLMKR